MQFIVKNPLWYISTPKTSNFISLCSNMNFMQNSDYLRASRITFSRRYLSTIENVKFFPLKTESIAWVLLLHYNIFLARTIF
jgi:hypothetical protein